MQIRAMANNGIGVGEGFYGDSVSSGYYNLENLLHGNSMDQGGEQNLRQQSGQSSDTNALLPGFLPSSIINQGSQAVAGTQRCPWLLKQFGQPTGLQELLLGFLPSLTINQGSHQAVATGQPLMHQHLGQSLATSIGDPHSQRNYIACKVSAPDLLLKKRAYDKAYRQRVKEEKQALVAENGKLKYEVQEIRKLVQEMEQLMKSNQEGFEAEKGKLKCEIQAIDQQMKSNMETLEAEIKLLKGEFESLKRNNVSVNQKVQTQSTELTELRNTLDELKKQKSTDLPLVPWWTAREKIRNAEYPQSESCSPSNFTYM